MKLLLGIDLGTSYFKAGLYEADGTLQGLARIATPIERAGSDRREMDPDDFWQSLRKIIADALVQAKANAQDIVALSYSSQANSFVLLDTKKCPLTPIVIWQDRRALDHVTPLREYRASDEYFQKTGLSGLGPEGMLGKLEWFRVRQAGLWKQVRHVFTLSDYLASTLLGKPCGDSGSAALTGLWDVPGDRRHTRALELAEVDEAWLAPLVRPGMALGEICPEVAYRLGLEKGVLMAAGSLDHHAAALGSGVGRLASASLSTGTVLAALRLTERWQPRRGCFQGPDSREGRYFCLNADNRGAGFLEMLRQRHAPSISFEEMLDAVEAIPEDAILPKIDDEVWDDPDPSNFPGLCLDNLQDLAYVVRSAMVSVAFRQRSLLEKLFDGELPDTVIATGGGARSPLWLQMKVKALKARVLEPESEERACLGAALFASVAAGICRDAEEASACMVKPGRVWE